MDPKRTALDLRRSIQNGDIAAVKAAFKAHPGLFEQETVFGTWLHSAAGAGQLELAKLLVSMGADVNAIGGIADATPLLEAASEGHLDVVQYLIACGATLDFSLSEQNPLFAAAQGAHTEVAKALLDAGIDAKVKYSGYDALAFAREYGSTGIVELLSAKSGGKAEFKAKGKSEPSRPKAEAKSKSQPKAKPAKQGTRTLLHKHLRGVPSQFLEFWTLGAQLVVRSGEVKTRGESETIECDSPEAASKERTRRVSAAQKKGFRLSAEGPLKPGKCDFAALRREICEGARQAFTAVRKAHPKEEVNAFAIVSDDDCSTLVIAANTKQRLAQTQARLRKKHGLGEDCLWNTSEWAIDEGAAFLDVPYRRILADYHEAPGKTPSMAAFHRGFFEACVGALEQLRKEGCFDAGGKRKGEPVLVLFQISDTSVSDKVQTDWIARLNGKAMARRFHAWLAGDDE